MRGARRGDTAAPHLVAALDHATGTVLGQLQIGTKSNEIPALRNLLATMDITGVIVTADAMHCHRDTAQYITGRGGHYVLTVKGNQPTPLRQLKDIPWHKVAGVTCVDTSHGRRVRRTITAIETPSWIDFPGAGQVLQIRRTRTIKGKKTVEVVYAICPLPMLDAQPETVAAWIQAHWGIENRLHRARDVTFDEDRHRLRTGHGPHIMAALRNTTTSIHRRHQHHGRDSRRPINSSPHDFADPLARTSGSLD